MRTISVIIVLLTLIPFQVFSQDFIRTDEISAESVFQQIDLELIKGNLTPEEALAQKFYVAFDPVRALPSFLPEDKQPITRCLTPLFAEFLNTSDELSPEMRNELNSYIDRACRILPPAKFSHTSDSGKFIIHYDTTGSPHAVPGRDSNGNGIPDFIEQTAFAIDSTWNHLIGTLGFIDPVGDDSSPYEIKFRDLGDNNYGYTCIKGIESTTFMILHHNYEDFPGNNHPEGNQTGALYASVAHEFKHASQYATNLWRGDAGSMAWSEMDATMIEDIVFEDVNDNLHFLRSAANPAVPSFSSIFGNPGNSIPVAYNHFTWKLFFAEKFGMDYWVDVWNQFVDEPEKNFLIAMRESLSLYNTTLETEHLENLAWHLASGSENSGRDFGFKNREIYPNPNYNWTFRELPDSTAFQSPLQPLAANFILIEPGTFEVGNPAVSVRTDEESAGIGLLGFFRDGSIQFISLIDNDFRPEIQTRWTWEELERVGVIIVHMDEALEDPIRYLMKAESIVPEQIALYQNYPNPFNPETVIQFYLDRSQQVRIDIFDVIGRRVKTLTDQVFPQGHSDVRFNGADLASGVYLYRLVTDDQTLSKKMLLIK
jgi:hypothetical protein